MSVRLLLLFATIIPYWAMAQGERINWLDYWQKLTTKSYAAHYEEVCTLKDSVWHVLCYTLPEKQLVADYFVLDLDNRFKHGLYIGYHTNGIISDSGYFKHDYAEGKHYSWYANGSLASIYQYRHGKTVDTCRNWYQEGGLSSVRICDTAGNGYQRDIWPNSATRAFGNVLHGYKYGRWKYFNEEGQEVMELRFKDEKPLDIKCFDANGTQQKENCIYWSEPVYEAGEQAWLNFLSSETQFPRVLLKQYPKATVIIEFSVFTDGTIAEFQVVESPHALFTKEALRILQLSKKWKPAISINKPVVSKYTQVINFRGA